VRAGLLRSSRGVHGGFALAKPASDITLLEVIEAIEGPISVTNCVPEPDACGHSANCPASAVWARVQDQIAEILGDASLETLVSTPRRNGRVIYQLGA
jgi:Rrf2 family protein